MNKHYKVFLTFKPTYYTDGKTRTRSVTRGYNPLLAVRVLGDANGVGKDV